MAPILPLANEDISFDFSGIGGFDIFDSKTPIKVLINIIESRMNAFQY